MAGASGKGGNFIETIIDKAKKNETINAIDDMWMSPTYTKDAAEVIQKILHAKLPFGVYHITNQGKCTWYQFAKQIFTFIGLHPQLNPIKASQLQQKAKRPMFSALASIKLQKHGLKMREWKEALHDYLVEKGHIRQSRI